MAKTKENPKKQPLNRIGEVLKDKDMSGRALADQAGITQRSVSLYVTGKREPNLETLYKIAEVLKVDPCDLLR